MKITETTPTLEGPHGKAWEKDLESMRKKYPDIQDTTVKAYVVEAAWAHPFWKHYFIGVISFADVEGIEPAEIRLEGATHEIIVVALNPDEIPTVDDNDAFLTPINFTGQFKATTDEAASELLKFTVYEILNGILSPDTDFTCCWVQRFNETEVVCH